MIFQVIWFVLWSVLWAVYFMLDGFDLGAGVLNGFIAREEHEKRQILNAIGPVWNGNEVWLLTAGGATFAAFPGTYALMFSYLYTALLLVLFSLIIRGVALEFREKVDSAGWRKKWDAALMAGSFLPALLFGVAFGNIFEGLPMDGAGYHGSLFTLLNPYGLLTGVLFVLLFLVHGALYIAVKTGGPLSERAGGVSKRLWFFLLAVAVAFLGYTYFATHLYDNYLSMPVFLVVPILAVISLLCVGIFAARGSYPKALLFSCLTIAMVTFTGVIGLFPNLIPSSIDTHYSLTIFNSSSSIYTLKIMTVVALLFVPIVIAYQTWTYRIFRNKVRPEDVSESEAY